MRDTEQALSRYKRDMIEGEVASADPHRLIQMLLEGALSRIALAKKHMESKNISEKGRTISAAISIVACLQNSLDFEAGGELATNLNSLYDFIKVHLLEANLHNNQKNLDDCLALLGEIKGAWDAIDGQGIAAKANASTNAEKIP